MTAIRCDGKEIVLSDIIWLKGDWNYTRINYGNNRPVLSSRTLKWYEENLTDFIRIRKDVIVNPGYVKNIEVVSAHPRKLVVILHNGCLFEVTRRRQSYVYKKFIDLLIKNTETIHE